MWTTSNASADRTSLTGMTVVGLGSSCGAGSSLRSGQLVPGRGRWSRQDVPNPHDRCCPTPFLWGKTVRAEWGGLVRDGAAHSGVEPLVAVGRP
jgi:hypothetical protein